jgi:hypothetical protein
MANLQSRYHIRMKTEPTTPEMKRFNEALRDVLRVSKTDLNLMLAAEKALNADKPKRGPKPKQPSSASAHASERKD